MKPKAIFISCLLLICFFNVPLFTQAQNNIRVSCPESAQYYAKDSINIVTFGASTVEGVKGVGFQDMLASNFKNCYPGKIVDITNEGIGGQTTAQGLLRLDKAIKDRTGFFVVNMGINDAFVINSGKQTIENTIANMKLIISTTMAQKLVPIICTLQYLDDRNDKSLTAVNNIIRNINTAYRKIATDNKIYLADINNFMRRDFSLYQDALHPNARGYRLISYVIFDTINKAIFERFLLFTVPQNYPNPANSFTNLDIILPEPDKINIQIFDLMGRMVKTVINDYLNTGKHTLEIRTSDLVPGIYIIKMTSDSGLYKSTKKMIVAR